MLLIKMQETYGEDPWLSGYLTTAYVTGIQGGNYRGITLQDFHFLDFILALQQLISCYYDICIDHPRYIEVCIQVPVYS